LVWAALGSLPVPLIIGKSVDEMTAKLDKESLHSTNGAQHPLLEERLPDHPRTLGYAVRLSNIGSLPDLRTTLVIGRDGTVHNKHTGTTDFAALEREVIALLKPSQ
jgi:hypothetical protein